MNPFLVTLHIMACLVLVLVVLLQRGKGGDIGAALGGGSSNTVFGSRGAGNFLTKITTASAITFMVTSLTLSYLSTQDTDSVIFGDDYVEEESLPAGGGEADAAGDLLEEISPSELEEVSPDVLEEVVPADRAGEAEGDTAP